MIIIKYFCECINFRLHILTSKNPSCVERGRHLFVEKAPLLFHKSSVFIFLRRVTMMMNRLLVISDLATDTKNSSLIRTMANCVNGGCRPASTKMHISLPATHMWTICQMFPAVFNRLQSRQNPFEKMTKIVIK